MDSIPRVCARKTRVMGSIPRVCARKTRVMGSIPRVCARNTRSWVRFLECVLATPGHGFDS